VFRKHGIAYEPSELTRSELYLELLPLANSGRVELLDHARLVGQLAALERRVGRSGKDSIDHRPGAHDDLANAAAGALVMCVRSVGLKATYPADFTDCRVWNLVSWAPRCFLNDGHHIPEDPSCTRHCSGFKAARVAYADYTARVPAEDWKPLSVYTRDHFKPTRFQQRLWHHRFEESLGL
jgi:hypothetical protein